MGLHAGDETENIMVVFIFYLLFYFLLIYIFILLILNSKVLSILTYICVEYIKPTRNFRQLL